MCGSDTGLNCRSHCALLQNAVRCPCVISLPVFLQVFVILLSLAEFTTTRGKTWWLPARREKRSQMAVEELRLSMVGGDAEKGLTPRRARNAFRQYLLVSFTITSPRQHELLRPGGARILGVRT